MMMKSTTKRKRVSRGYATTGWMKRSPCRMFYRKAKGPWPFELCSQGLARLFGAKLSAVGSVRVVLYRKPRKGAVGIEARVDDSWFHIRQQNVRRNLLTVVPLYYPGWAGLQRFAKKLNAIGRERWIPLYAVLEVRR
jgi:hypothetical protein